MNKFEDLQDSACEDGIDVIDYHFDSDRIKGLYCDGAIAIKKDISTTEKACVLAEELGHHHTTVGNILDQSNAGKRKQERRARLWAYQKAFDLVDLISAYKYGCRNRYEIAEYLEVTEQFLEDAIYYYRQKYGCKTTVDNYVIFFEPSLAVMKII